MITEQMWDAANTISALVGLLLSGILVARFYYSYINSKYRAVIIGITFFLVMTVLYLIPFIMTGITAYIVGGSAVFIVSAIMDRRNIPQKIFLSVTIYMLLWISGVIALLPWKVISKATYLRAVENERQFALFIVALTTLVIIEKILLFLAIYITERVYSRRSEQMEWRELSILVTPYIAVIAGYWISSFMSDAYVNRSGEYIWNNYPVYELIRPAFGVIAFFVVISVIYSYQQIKKSQEEALQSALVSKQVDELTGHVHTIEKLYSDIRGIRHDVNSHIMILGNLLDKGEDEEARAYLNEWRNGFPMPEITEKTGNPVTDIILSEKKREAEEAGIGFTDDFHYPASGKVESIDIGVILNNALANAIRAASNSDEKWIEVSSRKNNNAFLIQVKNSFSGELPLNTETGYPDTSKPDRESHGYGLMNMKRITEKYYGMIRLEKDGDMVVFTSMMMIPD